MSSFCVFVFPVQMDGFVFSVDGVLIDDGPCMRILRISDGEMFRCRIVPICASSDKWFRSCFENLPVPFTDDASAERFYNWSQMDAYPYIDGSPMNWDVAEKVFWDIAFVNA